MKQAVEFLREFGPRSLVSLGCGDALMAIDNHVRLMAALGLEYYAGVDILGEIRLRGERTFWYPEDTAPILDEHFGGQKGFFARVRVFPSTWAEELHGIDCAAVVVQRPLPGYHFEGIIESMDPAWVLQEGLHGCELQRLPGRKYRRLKRRENPFGLLVYPVKVFSARWERNYVLWERRECFG